MAGAGSAYRSAAESWFYGLAPPIPLWPLEGRWPWELGLFLATRPLLLATLPKGDGQPVLVLPGLGSGDEYTVPMRGLLKDLGFKAHPWTLGVNNGLKRGLFDAMGRRLAELHARYDQPISLVGWSLGGTFARQLAKAAPDAVRQVITLGSPFAHARAVRRGQPIHPAFADLPNAPPVPTSSIFTRTDGIVDWVTNLNKAGVTAENIEVPGSHIGLGFNPLALYAVADRLAQPTDKWAPFERTGLRRLVFGSADRQT